MQGENEDARRKSGWEEKMKMQGENEDKRRKWEWEEKMIMRGENKKLGVNKIKLWD